MLPINELFTEVKFLLIDEKPLRTIAVRYAVTKGGRGESENRKVCGEPWNGSKLGTFSL